MGRQAGLPTAPAAPKKFHLHCPSQSTSTRVACLVVGSLPHHSHAPHRTADCWRVGLTQLAPLWVGTGGVVRERGLCCSALSLGLRGAVLKWLSDAVSSLGRLESGKTRAWAEGGGGLGTKSPSSSPGGAEQALPGFKSVQPSSPDIGEHDKESSGGSREAPPHTFPNIANLEDDC
eukprot:536258-Pelagomonas_calceolata.AAC.1